MFEYLEKLSSDEKIQIAYEIKYLCERGNWRDYTNIPFSSEIFAEITKNRGKYFLEFDDEDKKITIEAVYDWLTNKVLKPMKSRNTAKQAKDILQSWRVLSANEGLIINSELEIVNNKEVKGKKSSRLSPKTSQIKGSSKSKILKIRYGRSKREIPRYRTMRGGPFDPIERMVRRHLKNLVKSSDRKNHVIDIGDEVSVGFGIRPKTIRGVFVGRIDDKIAIRTKVNGSIIIKTFPVGSLSKVQVVRTRLVATTSRVRLNPNRAASPSKFKDVKKTD